MTGKKHDQGKTLPDLILRDMSQAILAVAEVATFGAGKYTAGGWLHVDDAIERYRNAKQRHMLASATEERDGESGLLHAAHEAWNALAVLELMLRQDGEQLGKDLLESVKQVDTMLNAGPDSVDWSNAPVGVAFWRPTSDAWVRGYDGMWSAYSKESKGWKYIPDPRPAVVREMLPVPIDWDTAEKRMDVVGQNGLPL